MKSHSEVFLDTDDQINIVINGNLNRKSMGELLKKADLLVDGLVKDHKPVVVMADITHLGKSDLGARLYGATHLKRRPLTKLAILSTETPAQLVSKMLIRASGKLNKTKYFTSYESARAWLKK